jgi:amidase
MSATLDTVGPMGKTVAAVEQGMALLEPGFRVSALADPVVGRFRLPADPVIDAAIDGVLQECGFQMIDIDLPHWDAASQATRIIANADAWLTNRDLVARAGDKLGRQTRDDLAFAQTITPAEVAEAHAVRALWRDALRELFKQVDFIAMPTLTGFPPSLASADSVWKIIGTRAWSLAGVPALALPLPSGGPIPTSLQLIALWGHEDQLLAAGSVIEKAAAASSAS